MVLFRKIWLNNFLTFQGLPGPPGEKGETGDVGQMVRAWFVRILTVLSLSTFTLQGAWRWIPFLKLRWLCLLPTGSTRSPWSQRSLRTPGSRRFSGTSWWYWKPWCCWRKGKTLFLFSFLDGMILAGNSTIHVYNVVWLVPSVVGLLRLIT